MANARTRQCFSWVLGERSGGGHFTGSPSKAEAGNVVCDDATDAVALGSIAVAVVVAVAVAVAVTVDVVVVDVVVVVGWLLSRP